MDWKTSVKLEELPLEFIAIIRVVMATVPDITAKFLVVKNGVVKQQGSVSCDIPQWTVPNFQDMPLNRVLDWVNVDRTEEPGGPEHQMMWVDSTNGRKTLDFFMTTPKSWKEQQEINALLSCYDVQGAVMISGRMQIQEKPGKWDDFNLARMAMDVNFRRAKRRLCYHCRCKIELSGEGPAECDHDVYDKPIERSF